MSPTLREQLSQVALLRSTTVLRLGLQVPSGSRYAESVRGVLAAWLNPKLQAYGAALTTDTMDLSRSQGEFAIDFTRNRDAFAVTLEEPDSTVTGRAWTCDCVLIPTEERSVLDVRLSYKQPSTIALRPDPRTPRFLREVLSQVPVGDVIRVAPAAAYITAAKVPALMELLQSPTRTLPVIAISADLQTGEPTTDVSALTQVLAGSCHIVQLDPEASWALTNAWTKTMAVYAGGVRCYNAGFSPSDDKMLHRLWLPDTIARLNAQSRNGFVNATAQHVFAQVNAMFEPSAMRSPTQMRRQRATPLKPVKQAAPEVAPTEPTPVTAPAPDQDTASIVQLAVKLAVAEAQIAHLEEALQQERAGRAETERQSTENAEMLALYQEENSTLTQERELWTNAEVSGVPEFMKPLMNGVAQLFQMGHTMSTHVQRLESEVAAKERLEVELREMGQANINLRAQLDGLQRTTRATVDADQFQNLRTLIPSLVTKNPPLELSLRLAEAAFPERLVVLPTAYVSARESSNFLKGPQAYHLIWKLVTEYWEQVQVGGDEMARNAFTQNTYASTEKSTISVAGIERRTFAYNGKSYYMDTHLKMGTADNKSETLRVHFAWVAEEEKIVIGHCGKHLDF